MKMSEIIVFHSEPAFTCPKLTIETLEQGVNSGVFIVTPCSSVSIFDSEHVIAGWVQCHITVSFVVTVPEVSFITKVQILM